MEIAMDWHNRITADADTLFGKPRINDKTFMRGNEP